jgi:hypothetical protein
VDNDIAFDESNARCNLIVRSGEEGNTFRRARSVRLVPETRFERLCRSRDGYFRSVIGRAGERETLEECFQARGGGVGSFVKRDLAKGGNELVNVR